VIHDLEPCSAILQAPAEGGTDSSKRETAPSAHRREDLANIFEICFNFESAFIIVSTPLVKQAFSRSALSSRPKGDSVFRVQERKTGVLPLLPPEH
jgi:hypothetical protein